MSKAIGKPFKKEVWQIVGGVWHPKNPDYDITSPNGTRLRAKYSNFRRCSRDWNWNHLFGDYDRLILGGRFPDGRLWIFDLPRLPIKGLCEIISIVATRPPETRNGFGLTLSPARNRICLNAMPLSTGFTLISWLEQPGIHGQAKRCKTPHNRESEPSWRSHPNGIRASRQNGESNTEEASR
jgi:hypothetical protein